MGRIPLPLRVGAPLALALVLAALPAAADSAARVFLNGVPTPVYFNDGDSFRVLAGPFQGTSARLAGYNTLESFGPVHMFGDWKPYELFVIAKMATLNARRGTWHCDSDGSRDGYGRILWHCPDLGLDQVRRGLAHALSVNREPADPALLAAQREAQAARRGLWAHGIPDYVVSSLHSLAEDPDRPSHYNRAVSALDGHSADWSHRDTYEECATVCYPVKRVPAAVAEPLAKELLADPALGPGLAGWTPESLGLLLSDYAREGKVTPIVPAPVRDALEQRLAALKSAGRLAASEESRDSCHVYVDFKRRFGLTRASCLARH